MGFVCQMQKRKYETIQLELDLIDAIRMSFEELILISATETALSATATAMIKIAVLVAETAILMFVRNTFLVPFPTYA